MDKGPLILLASRSPRRAGLLREAGYRYRQGDPPFADPPQPEHGEAVRLAQDLAQAKARSVREADAAGVDVILAADTIVVAPDGTLLGQPAHEQDARRMLGLLVEKTHQVVTGVCLRWLATGRLDVFADVARVTFGAVSVEELDRYLSSGGWRGKAGAYNLAELEGHWPIRVDGDPTTVVGLPMATFAERLRT